MNHIKENEMKHLVFVLILNPLLLLTSLYSAEAVNNRIQIFQSLYASEAEEIAREAIGRGLKPGLRIAGEYIADNNRPRKIISLTSVMNTYETSQTLTFKIKIGTNHQTEGSATLKESLSFHIPISAYLRLFDTEQASDPITWRVGKENYQGSATNTKSGRLNSIKVETGWDKNRLGPLFRKEIILISRNGIVKEIDLRIWHLQEPLANLGYAKYQEIFHGSSNQIRRVRKGVLLCDRGKELGTLRDFNQIKNASQNKTPGNFEQILSHEKHFQNSWNYIKVLVNSTK